MSLIPKHVHVAGHKIRVTWKEMYEDTGEYDHEKRVIRLSLHLKDNEDKALEVLVHEMAHAATYLSGIKWVLGDDTEEAVVRMLETIYVPAIIRLLS